METQISRHGNSLSHCPNQNQEFQRYVNTKPISLRCINLLSSSSWCLIGFWILILSRFGWKIQGLIGSTLFNDSIFVINLKFITLTSALTASMDDTENFDEFKHLWVEPNVVGFTDKFQVEKFFIRIRAFFRIFWIIIMTFLGTNSRNQCSSGKKSRIIPYPQSILLAS